MKRTKKTMNRVTMAIFALAVAHSAFFVIRKFVKETGGKSLE